MINDAFEVKVRKELEQYFDETPSDESKRFYDQLESNHPRLEGSLHFFLSIAASLMNIQQD